MASFTRPLNLRANITVADTRFDAVAGLNVLVLCLMLYLFGSSYLYAPGMLIDVSGAPRLPQTLALPTSAARMPGVDAALSATVLTVQRDNVFLLEGNIHSLETLARALPALKPDADGVLLVKAEREVSLQTFVSLCALARHAGFKNIQIAVEAEPRGAEFRDAQGRPMVRALPAGD